MSYFLKGRNVNILLVDALWGAQMYKGHLAESRNGPVIRFPSPTLIEVFEPRERVLFWPPRDANPFFHFMESLWMLNGQNDLATLAHYNRRMENYSDDGVSLHGAYGHRWRYAHGFDQLPLIIKELKADPTSRRCVLSMWSPSRDLGEGLKDHPCNTHAYFDIEEGRLNLTVCNRSNDLVWGAFGANIVHFTVLQEVMAAMVGVTVGRYNVMTNNLHLYTELGPGVKLMEEKPTHGDDPYARGEVEPYPIVADYETWFIELREFMSGHDLDGPCNNPFFDEVAAPLRQSWAFHKYTDPTAALETANRIAATDWRRACVEWLGRRLR